MPIATIEVLEGYDAPAKSRLGKAITDAIRSVIDAPPEVVTVVIRDIPAANYFRGGTTRQPGLALHDGAALVRDYLGAMEARDFDRARSYLAPGFTMTFPGGVTMHRLEDLVAWSAPRYRLVKKHCERFDAMGALIYCFGTLSGEWPDGTAFESIRFIDRFELQGGQILRQDVWNDMGEAGATGAGG